MKTENLHAFIGGDMRQVYLIKRFIKEGKDCLSYSLRLPQELKILSVPSLYSAIHNAKYIFCPLPFQTIDDNDTHLLLKHITPEQVLFGGTFPHQVINMMRENQIKYFDYMESEELTHFNAIATAEGILAEAITAYPGNLHGSHCLVTGYGRCGRVLAHKLAGLGAKVTVCTRRTSTASEAYSMGYKSILYQDLDSFCKDYELIFNTVPDKIITDQILRKMDPQCYVFDLASAPGGVDSDAAARYGIHVSIHPGLPGLYAPAASADALYDFIEQTINRL